MTDRLLVLYDDDIALDWQPFTLTRPAGELRFGTLRLRERAERVLGARCVGHLSAPHLREFDEPDAPPVIAPEAVPADAPVIFLSSRAVLAPGAALPEVSTATVLQVEGEPCGWVRPAGVSTNTTPPDGAPHLALDGFLLERVWELVTRGSSQTAADIEWLHGARPDSPREGVGYHRFGDHRLVLGERVRIEPGVIFDLRAGPIWLDDDVDVRAPTRIAGPSYFGPNTSLFGGSIWACTAGPRCKLHGEMEETVVLGYSNKAHDGFIGHAYLGMWVNLGALTTNSDLKNNYGEIEIWTPEGEVDTGETKLGSLLGDHVKTGIGTILNTGTVIGAGTAVFGGDMLPKYVPPFRWGTGESLGAYDVVKFLETAEIVMARRDVVLTEGQREMLRAACRIGCEQAEDAEKA